MAFLVDDEALAHLDLSDIATKSTFEPIPISVPEAWIEQTSSRLNQVVHLPNGRNRAAQWSKAELKYEILP